LRRVGSCYVDRSAVTAMWAEEEVLSPPAGIFNPGWNWIGIRCQPSGPAADAACASEHVERRLYRWDLQARAEMSIIGRYVI
jgi:hypothetical protein